MLTTDACANLQEASNFEMGTKRIDHVEHFLNDLSRGKQNLLFPEGPVFK